jgi:drug/metabolite transporter (DMT)-like permease
LKLSHARRDVLLSALLFGFGAVLVKTGGSHAMVAAVMRCLLTAVLLAAFRPEVFRRKAWDHAAIIAACAAVLCNFAFVAGFAFTKTAVAISIAYSSPLLCPWIAWLWNGERTKARDLWLILLGTVGVFVVASGTVGGGGHHLLGAAAAGIAAIAYAFYIVAQRKIGGRLDVVFVGNSTAAVLGAVVVAIFLSAEKGAASSLGWFSLNGAACAVAFLLVTRAIPRLSAAETGLLAIAEVPCAIVAAALFLGEYPSSTELVGVGIVLLSIVLHILGKRGDV